MSADSKETNRSKIREYLVLIAPPKRGFKMLVEPGFYEHWYGQSLFEEFTSNLLLALARNAVLFIDIGAHYGYYTLLVGTRYPSCKVIAFEPNPASFQVLQQNVTLNKLTNVRLYQLAASDKTELRKLHIAELSSRCSFHYQHWENPAGDVVVNSAPLDEVLQAEPELPTVIKIDTGGHEPFVLAGMKNLLRNSQQVTLFIEFNPKCLRSAGCEPVYFLKQLRGLGFDIYAIDDRRKLIYKLAPGHEQRWRDYLPGSDEKSATNLLCIKEQHSLNVLFFCPQSGLAGADRSLLELIKILVEDHGVLCTVVLPSEGLLRAKLEGLGVATLITGYHWWCGPHGLKDKEIQRRYRESLTNILAQIADFGKVNPDVVVTNTLDIPWGAIVSHFLDKPHAWFVREFGKLDHNWEFYTPFDMVLNIIKDSSNIILCNSDAVRETLFGRQWYPPVITVHPYIDIPPEALAGNAECYLKNKQAIKLIIAGAVLETKGQKDAVLAVKELVARGHSVELVILGDGDPVYLNRLKELVQTEHLEPYVSFIAHKENPYPILSQADIVLVCSRCEAFGRITLEAMLLKKPVIGTNTGGTPELVVHGSTGLLYSPGDYIELADKIEYLIEHPDKIKEFGENGYTRAKEKFTREATGGQLYTLLKHLKGERNRDSAALSAFVSRLITGALPMLVLCSEAINSHSAGAVAPKLRAPQKIALWLIYAYQRAITMAAPKGTRRRYYYELALAGIRVLLNEGWRGFRTKLRQWLARQISRRLLLNYTTHSYYRALIASGIVVFLNEGWQSFWQKLKIWLKQRLELAVYTNRVIRPLLSGALTRRLFPNISDYTQWLSNSRITPRVRRLIEADIARFAYRPKFSIIMPVFNPPLRFLREAIESVQAQVYPDWEVCICDNGSETSVKSLLRDIVGKDQRLKLITNAENLGISEGTNSALRMAQGEFIVLLDHDDVLDPAALYYLAKALNEDPCVDVLYSDRDHVDERGLRHDPYFKPDWSPHTILSHNYIIHLLAFRATLLNRVGLFRKETDGSQDYDMILRLSEVTNCIKHIPRVLYSWRRHRGSTSLAPTKPFAYDSAIKAITDALVRRGHVTASVAKATPTGPYRVAYQLSQKPLVSIIISAYDVEPYLQKCVASLRDKSTYNSTEIIIVTNNPSPQALADFCYKQNLRLCACDSDSYVSVMNNRAAGTAKGDYLIFLSDATEVITPEWIENMLSICQLPEVGAVGPLLLTDGGRIQFTYAVTCLDRDGSFYFFCPHAWFATSYVHGFSANVISDASAVSDACMMVKRQLFDSVGGFDAANFPLAFHDIDLCFRFLDLGLNNIYTPYAKLIHHGVGAKKNLPGFDGAIYTPYLQDARRFCAKHVSRLQAGEPCFNKNLWGIGAFRSPPPLFCDDQYAPNLYDQQYWARYGYHLIDEMEAITQRRQRVETIFKPLASRIVSATGCRKVIDIGCGLGELVEAFRALGIEAVGIASSSVQRQYIPETVLPFIIECSITDPHFHLAFSERYGTKFDVAVAIELFEHLPERKIDLALQNTCSLADIVVVTTPKPNLWDCSDPTHFLVRPPQYWKDKFSANGFVVAAGLTQQIFGLGFIGDEDSLRLVFQRKR